MKTKKVRDAARKDEAIAVAKERLVRAAMKWRNGKISGLELLDACSALSARALSLDRELVECMADTNARLAAVEAQAAAMRLAFEKFYDAALAQGGPDASDRYAAEQALSSGAGAKLLAEVKRLREALRNLLRIVSVVGQ